MPDSGQEIAGIANILHIMLPIMVKKIGLNIER